MTKKLSRRLFLRGIGAAAASLAIRGGAAETKSRMENGQGTDMWDLSDDTVTNLSQDDDTAGWVASFVGFNTNGWMLDFTGNMGTAATDLAVHKSVVKPELSIGDGFKPDVLVSDVVVKETAETEAIVAVTRTTCNVVAGYQDITTADMGGLTPKAAFFVVTQVESDDVMADCAVIGVGAATVSDEKWAIGVQSEDGLVMMNYSGMTDEHVIKLSTGDANVDGEADFVTFITNGIRINWRNAPTAPYPLTVSLFGGRDLSAEIGISLLTCF